MGYETFDFDLANAKPREDAFCQMLLLPQARFEVKRDYKAQIYGNLAFEYEQINRRNERVPSGIALGVAYYLGIEFRDDCRLILPMHYAKQLARLAIKRGLAKWVGDDNNSHISPVPWGWVLQPPDSP